MNVLYASQGQNINISVLCTDENNLRSDYEAEIESIYFPDLSRASGYPSKMIRIAPGLYSHTFTIPLRIDGVFTALVKYKESGKAKWDIFLINVNKPLGRIQAKPG